MSEGSQPGAAAEAMSVAMVLVKPWEESAIATKGLAAQVKITTAAGFETAQNALLGVKQTIEGIKQKQKEIVKPFQDAVKNLNGYFARPIALLEEAERAIKAEVARYSREIAAERAVQASKGEMVLAAPPELVKGVTIVTSRKWVIVSDRDVPRHFCSPDAAKIDHYLAHGGIEAIPGIRFVDVESVKASKKGGAS